MRSLVIPCNRTALYSMSLYRLQMTCDSDKQSAFRVTARALLSTAVVHKARSLLRYLQATYSPHYHSLPLRQCLLRCTACVKSCRVQYSGAARVCLKRTDGPWGPGDAGAATPGGESAALFPKLEKELAGTCRCAASSRHQCKRGGKQQCLGDAQSGSTAPYLTAPYVLIHLPVIAPHKDPAHWSVWKCCAESFFAMQDAMTMVERTRKQYSTRLL